MAQQLYWSVTAEGVSSATPPPGLECALEECNSTLVLYVTDESDPDAPILDIAHADVLTENELKGRLVATILVTIINAVFISATKKWEFQLQYDETALVDGVEELDPCDVKQAECFTPEIQAKLSKT